MIEQGATVLQVNSGSIVIATIKQSGCNACDIKSGCGTSLIGRLFPSRPAQRLELPFSAIDSAPRVGDRVVIGIDEGYLQKTTLKMYAIPLLGLLGGAIGGHLLGSRPGSLLGAEPLSIVFCLLGLSAGLWLTRRQLRGQRGQLNRWVRVLRTESTGVAVTFADPVPSPGRSGQ